MTSRRTLLKGVGLAGLAALPLAGCARLQEVRGRISPPAMVGGVEMFDTALPAIIDPAARAQVLATNYTWAEGPAWVADQSPVGGYLLFNDPGNNVMYRYRPGEEVEEFLRPSGLQTPVPPEIREPGANGMAIDGTGRLVIADSGTRAIVAIDLATLGRTVLADRFEGRRFNSPNDLTIARDGAIYFTDPPYGFAAADESPLREVGGNGLYRRAPDGTVRLLDTQRRPNGVGLSPDERTLYLALSDEQRPQVLAYPLGPDGMPAGPARLFHDMTRFHAEGRPGLPDGMDVAADGTVFATGPGGVHVLTPDGRLLGIIGTGSAVANCAIGRLEDGGRCLYLTAHTTLARIALKG
ncbi:SMP-30/gluconolactonase/LRE family protein [Croceibacterium sp. TMG7-5b_MA50]|uniref:SMP-30/gluconolactonase/LRE family protein n=1 Tax=Croceibacterium sp. TMG7-5b_MA50 TaxID=3121290 RepID=UPI003221E5A8